RKENRHFVAVFLAAEQSAAAHHAAKNEVRPVWLFNRDAPLFAHHGELQRDDRIRNRRWELTDPRSVIQLANVAWHLWYATALRRRMHHFRRERQRIHHRFTRHLAVEHIHRQHGTNRIENYHPGFDFFDWLVEIDIRGRLGEFDGSC